MYFRNDHFPSFYGLLILYYINPSLRNRNRFSEVMEKNIEHFAKFLRNYLPWRPKSGISPKEILFGEFLFGFCEIFQNSCSIVEHL